MTRDEISRNQRTTLLALRLLHGIYSRRRSCGPIHHLCNIAASPSDLVSSETAIFPHNNPWQTFAPFFANPRLPFDIISPLLQLRVSRSIARRFAFFSAPSGEIVRRKGMTSSRGKGREKKSEKKRETRTHQHSVIARSSRMGAVTNVFRWHVTYELAMNICCRRKYLRALYCARGGVRSVLMQNPFGNRAREKAPRAVAVKR